MVLMDNCLADLYNRCAITYDTALSRARYPENFLKNEKKTQDQNPSCCYRAFVTVRFGIGSS